MCVLNEVEAEVEGLLVAGSIWVAVVACGVRTVGGVRISAGAKM